MRISHLIPVFIIIASLFACTNVTEKPVATFNVATYNIRQLNESDSLADSYEKCGLRYAPNGTFNSYHTEDYTDSRIDHIFVSPDVQVDKYGVLTDTYRTPIEERNDSISKANDAPTEITLRPYTARVPSDHFPVMVQVSI